MKAYGSRGNWDLEHGGVPTKIGQLTSKTRHQMRRNFHKRGRIDAKDEIKLQLKDLYREN